VWLTTGGGVLLIVVVVLVVVLMRGGLGGGSGSIVTQANYDKITFGMSEEEVRRLLGPPTATEQPGANNKFVGFGTVLVWRNGGDDIKVFIVAGQEMGKSCKLGVMSRHQQGF
jgi:hypothetical protein